MLGKRNGFEKTDMTPVFLGGGCACGMYSHAYTIGTLFIGISLVYAYGKDSSIINCTSKM